MTLQSYYHFLLIVSSICNVLALTSSIFRSSFFTAIGVYGSFILALILCLLQILWLNQIIAGLIWLIPVAIWLFNIFTYNELVKQNKF